ncbi:MAG: methyltransferase domain-containing protein [Pseudomonadota bacterium]
MASSTVSLDPRKEALARISYVLSGAARAGDDVDPKKRLSPAERAEAKRLADAVFRHRPNLDSLLQPHLTKSPPPSVRHILYIVMVECLLFGAKGYATVHTAVELAKRDRATKGKFAALVNAVSRKIADMPPTSLTDKKPPKLPKYLRGPMIGAYGQPVVERIETIHTKTPPIDLCFASADDVETAAHLGTQFAPNHLRLSETTALDAVPGFSDGRCWVQDFAAQCPVASLGKIAGLNVLDLCAAPGGKTMQLAAAGAHVTAVDLSEKRLQRLHENLARTNLSATVICADILSWEPEQAFDVVVLDAPCSATGTLRRHPDLPFLKSTLDITALVDLQRSMVERAVSWVSPNGRLLVVTCSLLPQEGEKLDRWVQDGDFGIEPLPFSTTATSPDAHGISGHRGRLRPDMFFDRGGMDGFFFALYRKTGKA